MIPIIQPIFQRPPRAPAESAAVHSGRPRLPDGLEPPPLPAPGEPGGFNGDTTHRGEGDGDGT